MSASVEIIIRVKDQGSSETKKVKDGLKGVGDQADKSKDQMRGFGEMATGALRRVGEIATNALMAAGQAVVGFISDSVSAAGDYEQSMNMLGAVTGATANEIAAASAKAKELGGDLTLPATSAASAGEAMTELAKAGMTVQESMDAAKGTLQLAAAASIGEAQAAEIAANALNSFGLAATDAGFVADLLAASANASSIEITDTADSFKMASAVFSSFQGPVVGAKQAMVDMTTAIALLGNAGIKGSDAGTSLKQSLLQLAAPSDKAKGMMNELAASIGISGDIAYDASGKMRSLPEILDITAKATAGMTQEQRNYYVSTIFGADATRSILTLMAKGPAEWDKMSAAVTRQNAASELAAARMQGLKGAAQGLTSQIETLALEALEPLMPLMTGAVMGAAAFAGSLVGTVGPAVQGLISGLGAAGDVIQTGFMPAMYGAGAAVLAYALSSIPAATAALPALIVKVLASATAFAAQAMAVIAATGPLILIAAAVGGVALAIQDFEGKVRSQAQAMLDTKPFWIESTTAIENYATASDDARAKLAPYADAVSALRTQVQGEIEDLGKRMAAGLVSDAQYQTEMATINTHAAALQAATLQYNEQEQALIRSQAVMATGTQALAELTAGEAAVGGQALLTAEAMQELLKQMEETFQKGAQAVGTYVETEAAFLTDLQRQRKEGYDKNLAEQALAYAQEQAAQQAHLGQQLANYTTQQVQMGNITKEKGDAILGALERQYGITQDMSGRTFLAMTAAIDTFAASGSSDISALGGKLDGLGSDAVETRMKMDALAKKYTAELVENFKAGKITAEELSSALRAIPAKVYSEVVVTTTNRGGAPSSGANSGGSVMEARAAGGPVSAGTPYLIGERGPEVMVPNQSGTVIPTDRVSVGGTTINNYTLNYMGASASEGSASDALRTMQLLYG